MSDETIYKAKKMGKSANAVCLRCVNAEAERDALQEENNKLANMLFDMCNSMETGRRKMTAECRLWFNREIGEVSEQWVRGR